MRGGVRFNREDYRNTYLAYNPLTGQYGYVNENGAQGSIVPGEVGLWDPLTQASNLTQISSIPLDMQTIDANVGADWKIGAARHARRDLRVQPLRARAIASAAKSTTTASS